MVLTLAVTLIVVGFIAVYGYNVSFSPTGKPVTGELSTANVTRGFDHAAKTMPFPVHIPSDIPEDWHPSSFTMSTPQGDGVGTVPTVRGGWVTPVGAYITLIESAGSVSGLLRDELESSGTERGSVDVNGTNWTITDGLRNEEAWVRQTDDAALLITGNATEADFLTLAEAIAP